MTSISYACPVCGTEAGDGRSEADFMPDREGVKRWFYSCHKCHGQGLAYREQLPALADALDVTFATLQYRGPERAGLLCEPTRRARRPEPLPDRADLAAWRRALRGRDGREARTWLAARGIPFRVARRYGLGWSASHGALLLPLRRSGEVVNVKTRIPEPGGNMRGWPGRRAEDGAYPLFPEPEADDRWTLLVEGELDALAGRAVGLPACSVTLGVGTWRDDWAALLAERGRPVAVLFDAGEQAQAHAEDRVTRLREAGVRAARLDPAALGLTAKGADLTDYLAGGGPALALRRAARVTARQPSAETGAPVTKVPR